MRDVAHAASRPVPQCKDGFATQVSILFDECTQDKPLIQRQDTGSKRLLRLDLYPTRRVSPQDLFLFNQPLAKLVDDRLDARAVAQAIPLFFRARTNISQLQCWSAESAQSVSQVPDAG